MARPHFIAERSARTIAALLLSAIALPALFLSCDNSFSPKEPFARRLVVFAVLDKTAPFQSVRLEATYDAAMTNPDQPINKLVINDATVSIRSNRKNYVLHDTLLPQADGSMRKVWISYDLVPDEGTTYTLDVTVPGFSESTADASVPGKAYVHMEQQTVGGNTSGVTVFAGAISSATPKGFYFRLWVVGERTVNGVTVDDRIEIPSGHDATTGLDIYPAPSRETSVFYPMALIAQKRDSLTTTGVYNVIKLVATGYTFDTYLYSYYKITRGFQDPVSVRQDSPDVTNINNGVGIFGALVTDSVRAKYTDIIH